MTKKHFELESFISSHYEKSNENIIFESVADIQGFDKDDFKIIGEFKSKAA